MSNKWKAVNIKQFSGKIVNVGLPVRYGASKSIIYYNSKIDVNFIEFENKAYTEPQEVVNVFGWYFLDIGRSRFLTRLNKIKKPTK